MKTLKFLLPLALFCAGCNPDKIDTRLLKKEMEKNKIKKITEGQIISLADSTGTVLTDLIQKDISRKLDSSLAKGDLQAAIPICDLEKNTLAVNLEQMHNASISRTSYLTKLVDPDSKPDKEEEQILEAYGYNLEKKLPLFTNTQVDKDHILFYRPILLTEKNCLRCHGTPGKDLTEEEYKKILAVYPKNQSSNLKMNDFMGIWSVKFDKKNFIKNID